MTSEVIPTTYDEAVRTLARWHGGLDRPDLEIFSFPDPGMATVRLVEVSDDFALSTAPICAITFGASPEFPFRSSVALVTREQWQQIVDGELTLPEGWDLGHRERIWPDGAA
jgi:hypothetical protein